jgi:hypothetical protein
LLLLNSSRVITSFKLSICFWERLSNLKEECKDNWWEKKSTASRKLRRETATLRLERLLVSLYRNGLVPRQILSGRLTSNITWWGNSLTFLNFIIILTMDTLILFILKVEWMNISTLSCNWIWLRFIDTLMTIGYWSWLKFNSKLYWFLILQISWVLNILRVA